jgi:hypothetical protein
MLVPASMLRRPTATCEVGVLTPIWNVPGLAFSMSMTSFSELAGLLLLAVSADGTSATNEIGSKSLNGS